MLRHYGTVSARVKRSKALPAFPASSSAYLEVQNDGNVVIYSAFGSALWSTGTAGK